MSPPLQNTIINCVRCTLKHINTFQLHHRLYDIILWGVRSRLTATLNQKFQVASIDT